MAFDPRRDHAVSVYEQTWGDFYQWEQDTALKLLNWLDTEEDSISSDSAILDDFESVATSLPRPEGREPVLEGSYLQVFDEDMSMHTGVLAPVLRCATIRAGPQYESCDTLLANVFLGTAERIHTPRAMPFADDPSFNTDKYLRGLAGAPALGLRQEDQLRLLRRLQGTVSPMPVDPNLDAIELETLRRLFSGPEGAQYTLDEVQQLALLSRELSDLILHCWQRTMLDWPSNISNGVEPLQVMASRNLSSAGGFTLFCDYFSWFIDKSCFRPSCIETLCTSHPSSHRSRRKGPQAVPAPEVKEDQTHNPCRNLCYWSLSRPEEYDIFWSKDELDELAIIVSQCPGLGVCQLAVVMQKPCREVFIHRRDLHQRNPEVFVNPVDRVVVSRADSLKWPMGSQHTAFGCSHDGPCTPENNCSCTWMKPLVDDADLESEEQQTAQYCQSSCSCGPACGRQYPGCDCHSRPRSVRGKSLCRRKYCLCIKLGRDCERGVCGCVAGHNDQARMRCGNRDFSSAPRSAYKVAEGKYGYGLFARRPISAGQPIGEYMAEAVGSERAQALAIIAKHVGRNYVYDWSDCDELYLDALEAGNAARFINHADSQGTQANATSHIRWVEGDMKICITASKNIRPNQEILMDYGDNYFRSDSEDEDLLDSESPDSEPNREYGAEDSEDEAHGEGSEDNEPIS